MKPGDFVKIRGDLRRNMNGQCSYTPDQLVEGKYVKHTGHGGAWTGHIEKIQDDLAKVAGGWWNLRLLEQVTEEE